VIRRGKEKYKKVGSEEDKIKDFIHGRSENCFQQESNKSNSKRFIMRDI
jgi:hypothetical protein